MAAPKGNTYGKQFSKDYQPLETWTEEAALEVGYKLIEWLKAEEENIFFKEFLLIENDYYLELITYLGNKFKSFFKLLERASDIQEVKLVKFGTFDKLNATIAKFVLINIHNWKEKQEVDNSHTFKNPPKIEYFED